MSSVSLLRRLRRRSWPERWMLVRATVALAIMRPVVGLLPFRTIARTLGMREGQSSDAADRGSEGQVALVGDAVRSAAAHTPWESTCLMQALAAAVLLRQHAIDSTLYLGVAKDAHTSDGVSAHAWLRSGQLVLTGEAERERFTVIASFALPVANPRRSSRRTSRSR